jgi:hypothetical protein
MKKLLFLFILLAGISLFSAKDSSAQALSYQVINNTGFTLVDIFVSPAESNNWGSDILPNSLFENGSTVTVSIPEEFGTSCMFDMKITDTEGNYVVFSGVDACKLVALQINGDGTYSYAQTK